MIGDPVKPVHRWGVLWRSSNKLDGVTRHLICNPDTGPFNFRTRREAKTWIDETYGYIRERPDLRREPHGWRIPIPVRIVIQLKG